MANEYLLERFGSGMHYLMVDPLTVLEVTKNGNKRVICTLNDQIEVHCAIMPKKEGGHFINVGSAICKKLGIQEGTKVTADFRVDDTEYQFEMPEVLKEVLNSDPEADSIFHSLSEGNQRGLMYLVTQVKSIDKKIERALTIVEKLKTGITSPKMMLKQ